MIKKFPVAWLTGLLTFLTSAEAVAIWTHLLTPTQATWVGLGLGLLTAILGAATHGAVTPLADPRDNLNRPLVAAPTTNSPRRFQ